MRALQLYTLVCFLGLNFSCGEMPGPVKVIIVPETRTYTEKYPEIFRAKMDWLAAQADSIDFVIQAGQNTIRVPTCSLWLKAFKSGPEHQFVFT